MWLNCFRSARDAALYPTKKSTKQRDFARLKRRNLTLTTSNKWSKEKTPSLKCIKTKSTPGAKSEMIKIRRDWNAIV